MDSDDDADRPSYFTFQGNVSFSKFLVIQSLEEKAVTTLSPFVIEKQIESLIGTPKSVKKLKNKTLLVETCRKAQTDNLLKISTFFGLKVSVTEHTSLNSSKGIIRDRMLKGEKENEIVDYLREQGVTACKRFTIKKDHDTVETNTLLLTFNTVTVPKSLKIFYRVVPVDVYVPNPLRCFNCQRFGHHENNCPVDPGSVCATCGAGGHDHHTSACKNPAKCVNCGKDHVSRSSVCEIWKKEKEILKIKVNKNVTYLEARKLYESQTQTSDLDFTKIVHSLARPETKTTGTQFFEKDFDILPSSKVISPSVKPTSQPTSQPRATTARSGSGSQPRAASAARPTNSQSSSQSSSQSNSQSSSQSNSQSSSQSSSSGSQSARQTKEQLKAAAKAQKEKDKHRSPSGHGSGRRSHSGGGSSSNKPAIGGSSSNKLGKGSPDPVKTVNKYGALEDDMDTA